MTARVAIVVALALASCAPVATRRPDAEADSIVVLLGTDSGEPACNAVATGPHTLATAAHCVTHRLDHEDVSPFATRTANLGDAVWYVTRHEWYRSASSAARARVTRYDAARDVAILDTDQPVEPRRTAHLCSRCSTPVTVYARAGVFGWAIHAGHTTGRTFAGPGQYYWDATISIEPGWSGSPVFDAAGSVVGVVSACLGSTIAAGDHFVKSCEPNFAVFVDVP